MKKKITIVFLFVFLSMSLFSYAQDREAAIWNFGQLAGLDFNTLNPVSFDLGSINTLEGSASISDENGNLLMYSDGVFAYNRQHQIMPNGIDLLGGFDSTQSALIVPKPDNPNLFYLFTVSEQRVGNQVLSEGDGLNYYTVNMGAGNGSVNSLVTHLVTYNADIRDEYAAKCSQKLTAIKDDCEDFYWVVTHFRDSFYAFKVDENGVNATPVVSNVGPELFVLGSVYTGNGKGQLKFSPDGKRLAMANLFNNFDSGGHSPGSVYLFDFDTASGKVSNARQMMDDDFVFAYGIEFSPNSQVLYTTVSSFKNGNVPPSGHDNDGSMLAQIDLNDNYRYRKLFDFPVDPTALQLSIDGKIYMAHQRRRVMGVIHNPNVIGSGANYDDGGLSIGRTGQRGLPSFVQSYFQVRVDFEAACEGEPTQIYTNYLPEPDNIDWNFGDGTQLLNTLEKEPVHVYGQSGSYVVTATITKDGITETYSKQVQVRTLPSVRPATLTQCEDDGDGFAIFNINEAGTLINTDPSMEFRFFYSEEDAHNEDREILGITYFFSNELASQVFVRVENEFGCYRVTTLDMEVQSTAIPSGFMLNYSSCDDVASESLDDTYTDGIGTFDFTQATDEILSLFPNRTDLTVSYFQTEEDALAEIRTIDPGSYRNKKSPFTQQLWVRVDGADDNSCIGLGQHVTLTVNEVPDFDLVQQETICQFELPYRVGPSRILEAYDYEWIDEAGNTVGNTEFVTVFDDGEYTLIVTKTDGTGCAFEKTITIESVPSPIIQDVEVAGNISFQANVTVFLERFEGYEFALDDRNGPFQSSNILTEVPPGIHNVYVRDINGCELVSKEFSVIGYPPFFTPNNDGANDYWQLQGVSETIQPESLVYIYDRFGNFISKIDPSSQGWDGMMNGKTLPSTDYWFRVQLQDGRQFSGHFALVR